MDEEFYVTTILERHYIAKNTFVFSVLRSITGSYDEKTGIFTDEIDGEEYCSLLDMCQLTSEIPYAFNRAINIDELQEVYGETEDDYDVIKKYEDDIKNYAYIVRIVDGVPKCFTLRFQEEKNTDLKKKDHPPLKSRNRSAAVSPLLSTFRTASRHRKAGAMSIGRKSIISNRRQGR